MDIKELIIAKHKLFERENGKNLNYDEDYPFYLTKPTDNLLDGISKENWNEIKKDLMEGNGSELAPVKFNAVHSSAALCVNSFALVKQHIKKVSLFNDSNFVSAKFEQKFPIFENSRIIPPNLDFCIAKETELICVESKYIEYFDKTTADWGKGNSYNPEEIHKDIPCEFKGILERYKKYRSHLNVAQLIKHTIGIFKHVKASEGKITSARLIYLYWTPINNNDVPECRNHENDLGIFENEFKNIDPKLVTFESCTYKKYWEDLEKSGIPGIEKYVKKLHDRYWFEI